MEFEGDEIEGGPLLPELEKNDVALVSIEARGKESSHRTRHVAT